ncbi:MAG: hypothetical protein QGF87_04125 [Woeseiaceae bacterium]|jgi:uncharacterized peroxidase-related enzyme|nr:hypothetical protein [Woeseiaceae bacterium]
MAFVKSIPESEESVAAVMGRYPAMAMPMMQLAEEILRTGECAFTHEERELIGAYASGLNNCTYCYNTHKATAEAFGVDEGLLDGMVNDLDTADIDEKMRPVLEYVRKLTKTPSKMLQADADAIFDAGWDEHCFHYAIMICAMFNMMNRIMDGYGVKNTAEFRLSRGKILAETGYLPYGKQAQQ